MSRVAWVICNNDSIKGVSVTSKEHAEKIMNDMKHKDKKQNNYNYVTEEEYEYICYWHFHPVELFI